MSIDDYQWERIRCEKQIKHLINLRQRFCQYLKQNLNVVWYSDGQDFFQEDLECFQVSLIECIYDLINSNQLLSNENNDDFLLELKYEKSFKNNDKLDESMKRLYFKRRYQALINSREILLDDLSISIDEDLTNRMIKIRAVCVLDEALDHVQQELQNLDNYLSKSLEEQAAIRFHQIRAMINVYFKQRSQISFEESQLLMPLINSCDSFLSTFHLFFNNINLNSSSDIENQ